MTIPVPTSILACNRCDSPIQISDLDQGLAVRVDGELICQMCVDSLPGEAQVQINQLRAMRGLNATTYSLSLPTHPALHLFTFTTAGNITVHRRVARSDGTFDAPPLPRRSDPSQPPAAAQPPPPPAHPVPKAKSAMPLVLTAVMLAVGAGAAGILLQHHTGDARATATPSAIHPPAPNVPTKTRLDYDSNPVDAWVQANQDRDCPEAVLQGITAEVMHKRTQQLDEIEQMIKEDHQAEAIKLLSASTIPADITFRDLHQREKELRTQLSERAGLAQAKPPQTVAEIKPPAIPITPSATPAVQPPPPTPTPTPTPTPSPVIAASTGECWKLPGKEMLLEDTPQWKRVRNEIHMTVDLASVRRAVILDGGTYQVWIQALDHARDASVTVTLGGQKAKPVEIKMGGKNVWTQLQFEGHPHFSLPAGECMVEIDGSGRALEIHQLLIYDASMPSPEQSDKLHAKTPRWGATVPNEAKEPLKEAKEPAGVVAWKPHFVQMAKDAQIRQLPTDGSTYLPPGWPGGCQGFWRSVRLSSKKRQSMTLDLHDTSSDRGGIALLLHPGRLDRKEVQVTVFDANGKSFALPPFQFSGSTDWDVFTIQAKGDLEGVQIATVQLEDDANADFPADDGFLLAKVATCVNQVPTPELLGLRPPSLVRDEHRQKNLLKLLEAISRFRKHPIAKSIDPAKVKLLVGAAVNPEWRAALKGQLDAVLPGRLPANLIQEISFQENWLDGLFKSPGAGQAAVIDPQTNHLVILMTAASELHEVATASQGMDVFWKKRLEHFINNGILPVVVLGPTLIEADKRVEADKLWGELEDFIGRQLPGVPMIDLRMASAAPAAPGTTAAAAAVSSMEISAAMLGDGYSEFVYWLRRAAMLK